MSLKQIESSEGINFNMIQPPSGEALLPAIVVDRKDLEMGKIACVRMVGFMNQAAVDETLASGVVTFYSRSRQEIWKKGETSGNILRLIALYSDCDDDSLLALVDAVGPTCHTDAQSCFETE
jgi:phosphoribosyl-ATP pyrophosphohydrolase/phosphoribosyl-AMP cyclohydrolase